MTFYSMDSDVVVIITENNKWISYEKLPYSDIKHFIKYYYNYWLVHVCDKVYTSKTLYLPFRQDTCSCTYTCYEQYINYKLCGCQHTWYICMTLHYNELTLDSWKHFDLTDWPYMFTNNQVITFEHAISSIYNLHK